MPLSAVKSMRQRLGKQGGLTYEVEVVAQYAKDLPLPPGTRAIFVFKRRHRLCVTEAELVDEAGGVEWNTRCTQTATMYKEGERWRPKEFVFKVQAQKVGRGLVLEQAQTVAKATLDLSHFCTPLPLGPQRLVIPLKPCGSVAVTIRTQWLQHFDQEIDALTDMSYLSIGQSVATSCPMPAALAAEEQDLTGFDSGAAAAASVAVAGGPGLQHQQGPAAAAVGPGAARSLLGGGSSTSSGGGGAAAAAAAAAAGQAVPSPILKKRLSVADVLRLPSRRGGSGDAAGGKEQQQSGGGSSAAAAAAVAAPGTGVEATSGAAAAAAGEPAAAAAAAAAGAGAFEFVRLSPGGQVMQRSVTAPGSLTASGRRPAGASLLVIPGAAAAGGAAPAPAAAVPAAGSGSEASTPTLCTQRQQPQQQQAGPAAAGGRQQEQQQRPVAMGLPPECWSPINYQEAVEKLYDSEEEPTPRPTMFSTVKRMFGRGRTSTNSTPRLPATTPRQLHAKFNTPCPTPPKCTPRPEEVASIERETSMSALKRMCKRMMAERDEARAEGFAEAALTVEQSLEIDKLRRSKDMLMQRLQTAEQQLMGMCRDEAPSEIIQALAAARVEVAQRDFQLLEMQGQLRKKDALIDKLKARLTRAETKYRCDINALTPRARGGIPSARYSDLAAAGDRFGGSDGGSSSGSPEAGIRPGAASRLSPARAMPSLEQAVAGKEAESRRQQAQQQMLEDSPFAIPAAAGAAAGVSPRQKKAAGAAVVAAAAGGSPGLNNRRQQQQQQQAQQVPAQPGAAAARTSPVPPLRLPKHPTPSAAVARKLSPLASSTASEWSSDEEAPGGGGGRDSQRIGSAVGIGPLRPGQLSFRLQLAAPS